MSFTDPRSGIPYAFTAPFPSSHGNTICDALPYAVDARGGTYTQTAPLTFNGTQTFQIAKLVAEDARYLASLESKQFHHFTGNTITYVTNASTYPIMICDSMVNNGTITLGTPAADKQIHQIINNDPTYSITVSAGAGRTMSPGSVTFGPLSLNGCNGITVQADGTVWRVLAYSFQPTVNRTLALTNGQSVTVSAATVETTFVYNIVGASANAAIVLAPGYEGQTIYVKCPLAAYGINMSSTTIVGSSYGYIGPAKIWAGAQRGVVIRYDSTYDSAGRVGGWMAVGNSA
jgi:hypothetical protein